MKGLYFAGEIIDVDSLTGGFNLQIAWSTRIHSWIKYIVKRKNEMEKFKTISKNSEAEIVEKKSKFIAHVFYAEDIEEAEKYIKEIKKKYHDAKHNVFAYAIETSDRGNCCKI